MWNTLSTMMKTLLVLAVLATLAIIGFKLASAGSAKVKPMQTEYQNVLDMNDAQDAILKGAK